MKLRVIGDIHGAYRIYYDIIQNVKYSVQLGDFGFNYSIFDELNLNHRFVPGNHENYDLIETCKNSLGNFGPANIGPFSFWFVRGGFSIDCKERLKAENWPNPQPKTWWPEEQLNRQQQIECIELYTQHKPNVVLSHDCPKQVERLVGNPTILKNFGWPKDLKTETGMLLQDLFDIHKPELWIHGHYHRDIYHVVNGTTFICIGELNYLDFNNKWEIL